jgi:hypothetical protein
MKREMSIHISTFRVPQLSVQIRLRLDLIWHLCQFALRVAANLDEISWKYPNQILLEQGHNISDAFIEDPGMEMRSAG